ncbi:MAG: queuosine precursor transporter [Candidatus Peribacteria bacterium]|jgi:uncharacterized integral membrane protein (TIGR00697 family)|nr:queuosine precursor transporter [Candidatus Peribacteria bacterium]
MKFNKLDIMIGLYIFCIFAAETMGAKSFPLFTLFGYQLNASVAIFLLPLVYSINDIIIEVYGKARMKQIMRMGRFIVFLIMLVCAFFTALPPTARFAEMNDAYTAVFHMGIRMSVASLLSFIIANLLDIYIFAFLREKMKAGKLWIRTNVSNIISEFFDTFIFLCIAFYSLDSSFGSNVSFIVSIGIPYWILKCIMSLIATPAVLYGVKKCSHAQ